MSFASLAAIFQPDVRDILKTSPITIVDIGASGDLVEPWATVADKAPETIEIIGFEPDETECERLNNAASTKAKRPKTRFIPKALWNTASAVDIHLAEQGSTSSIYPPNWPFLEEFEDKHGKPRTTKSIVNLQVETLENATSTYGFSPDFIKIDTQGAEYEILVGMARVLTEQCIGCTLETWTSPVHKGQKLSFEVMEYMHKCAFRVFDIERSAVWQRRNQAKLKNNRGELVGFDLLYFKEPKAVLKLASTKRIKAAVLCDLWGYRRLACDVLDSISSDDQVEHSKASIIKDIIKARDDQKFIKPQSRLGIAKDKIIAKALGLRPSFPNIH
ncbi:MAG: FkbM family methyltransferase [Pseudomonadota bacterium]